MSKGRNTTTRDQHRRIVARHKPPCGLCGHDIDYALPYLDPGEYVVDHIVPLSKGGPDTLDNKQAAHRGCNERKGASLPEHLDPRRRFETTRTW